MIEVKNVSKNFGEFKALSDVSFHVEKGTICGLLGHNGAGKTTLLKSIASIYAPESGEIKIDGQILKEDGSMKQECFFIPDIPYAFFGYTIRQMANFYKEVYENWSESRFDELEKRFKIEPSKRIGSLSKGMKRQVAFWLALSTRPKVLLLDEPMEGLDPTMRKHVREMIVSEVANNETTIIISSHDVRELEGICDSILMIHSGDCIISKDIDELMVTYHDIQFVVDEMNEDTFRNEFNVLKYEKQGKIIHCILKGNQEAIRQEIGKLNPTLFEVTSLSLEEIFVLEMEVLGYA